ncbi:MAG: TIGR03915 family putative DNA repair protein [Bacteroidales bacterium]
MHEIRLAHATDLSGWRSAARALLAAGIAPGMVRWRLPGEAGDLFAALPPELAVAPPQAVPRAFIELADSAIRHTAPDRFDLLYRLLWRQARGERALLALRTDPDTARLVTLARQVRRDAYAMRAFVRFREVTDDAGPLFLAWCEPEYHVVELAAPHFVDRMGALRWSILTPLRSAHWDGRALHYDDGCAEPPPQQADDVAECWKTYYASIFNPARLKVGTMLSHMPKKYWHTMDETGLIAGMVREAKDRTTAMLAAAPTAPATKGRVRVERNKADAVSEPCADPAPP